MKLSQVLVNFFNNKSIKNGTEHFLKNQINIYDYTDIHFHSEIEIEDEIDLFTKEAYDTSIYIQKTSLIFSCNCRDFDNLECPCPHLYATLLEMEKNFLAFPNSTLKKCTEIHLDFDHHNNDKLDKIFAQIPPSLFSTKSSLLEQLPLWKITMNSMRASSYPQEFNFKFKEKKQLIYVFNWNTNKANSLDISPYIQKEKKNGSWSTPIKLKINQTDILHDLEQSDKALLIKLKGMSEFDAENSYYEDQKQTFFTIDARSFQEIINELCESKRLYYKIPSNNEIQGPLTFSKTKPFDFKIIGTEDFNKKIYILNAVLTNAETAFPLQEIHFFLFHHFIIKKQIFQFSQTLPPQWIKSFLQHGELIIPFTDKEEFLELLFKNTQLPTLQLPKSLISEITTIEPQAILKIHSNFFDLKKKGKITANIQFQYNDDLTFDFKNNRDGLFKKSTSQYIRRNLKKENTYLQFAVENGLIYKTDSETKNNTFSFPAANFAEIIHFFLKHNWLVFADNNKFKKISQIGVSVKSDINWFNVTGNIEFDGENISLPKLLKRINQKNQNNIIQLDDGSYGLLPEKWLNRFKLVNNLKQNSEKNNIQFNNSQALLLEALFSDSCTFTCDENYSNMIDKIRNFDGIKKITIPKSVNVELRDYQKTGFHWLNFLKTYNLGGCLADDMGLGKTLQVLTLLDNIKINKKTKTNYSTSIIIVPNSIIFNWLNETKKFTPDLKFLNFTGIKRKESFKDFYKYDVILTTYGSIRQDISFLNNFDFEYVILDESQAIKNSKTSTAKAIKSLRANHRLAMSGTPIENNLGELWSLMEFLNPGMLGTVSRFQKLTTTNTKDTEIFKIIRETVSPFLLRRKKEDVAQDLPEKSIQTFYCKLGTEQKKDYEELNQYYKNSLVKKMSKEKNMGQNKILIIEALLRMRQAACHPALIDKKKSHLECAKLDAVLPKIEEIVQENHKVLVFSQFTSFLAIVKKKLDSMNLTYEYLDGKTKNRQKKVERFQTDKKCKIFLISLKAGGTGLNLTAADYVFILDPWWNPAVEAQAIDRSHRIGQTKKVIAYKVIAKNTIEEKVMELQKKKADLADNIINSNEGFMKSLNQKDLEFLFE